MQFVDLAGTVREKTGKGVARKLRVARQVPAIVYGGPGGPQPVAVDEKALLAVLQRHGRGTVLINLAMDGGTGGGKRSVLLKEIQSHPVRGSLVHVDFLEIALDKKIRVPVPLQLEGIPAGKAKGGLVEWTLREITVECLPLAIPESLKVDITALDIGDSLHLSDLAVPEEVRIFGDPGRAVVSVVAPAAEEEVAAAAAPAAEAAVPAEPQVVAKGKEKEEPEKAEKAEKGEKGEKK